MIFTRSWLAEFIEVSNISDEKILSALNSTGFEVEGYRKIDVPSGVVVGKVVECEKHPNADKLNVCQVDNGLNVVTIVCGASNVAKDQLVAVATLGAKLPNGLVIKQAELRGIQSFGMLCSADELGLEKINDGILVFDDSVEGLKIGVELSQVAQIADSIFEIDITPNRSDCLSVHGIARELASSFGLEIKNLPLQNQKDGGKGIGRAAAIHTKSKTDSSITFKIAEKTAGENQKGFFLIEYRLALAGIKSKDSFGKLIDYSMHATGVVLNIFSAKSFVQNQDAKYDIYIEKDSNGFDIVKSGNELCHVGIVQHDETRPNAEDEVLIFSASYIEPSLLQEASAKIAKKDDALWSRSSKGSEPDLAFGLNYVSLIFSQYYSSHFYSGSIDDMRFAEPRAIKVDINKINTIIGEELDKNYIVGLLRKLNFDVTVNAEFNSCVVKAPAFRHDIGNVHDLAEEILRIKGIDTILATPLLIKEEKRANDYSERYFQYRAIRQKAVAKGFFETVHFIFADKKHIEKFGFDKIKESLDISNPITAELNTLRSTLLFNMLSSASKNFKNSAKSVAIFESGTVFDKNRKESSRMAFVWSGKRERESVLNAGKPVDIDFVEFASKITSIFGDIKISQTEAKGSFFHPFRYGVLEQDGQVVGFIGALHKKAEEYFELPTTFVCEIELDKLCFVKKEAAEFSRFQKSERDLTLMVPDELRFEHIKKCVESVKNNLIKEFFVVDSYKAESSQKDTALSIRFVLQSNERTLGDEDLSGAMQQVLEALSVELGIGLKQ